MDILSLSFVTKSPHFCFLLVLALMLQSKYVFPRPLYCDAAKNNINSYGRRKPPCWGLSQGPLFPSVSFLPFTIVQRGLTATSGTPLQSPHPQPCPRRAAFPPIYPRRAAPHQFQWKDPCLPPPKSREITSNNVFPTLWTLEKNGLFFMIENVYVTLKLKFKSCVLFIFIKYLEEDMESDICRLPETWRKVKAHWNRF